MAGQDLGAGPPPSDATAMSEPLKYPLHDYYVLFTYSWKTTFPFQHTLNNWKSHPPSSFSSPHRRHFPVASPLCHRADDAPRHTLWATGRGQDDLR